MKLRLANIGEVCLKMLLILSFHLLVKYSCYINIPRLNLFNFRRALMTMQIVNTTDDITNIYYKQLYMYISINLYYYMVCGIYDETIKEHAGDERYQDGRCMDDALDTVIINSENDREISLMVILNI